MNLNDYIEVPEEKPRTCTGCCLDGKDGECSVFHSIIGNSYCLKNNIILKRKEKTMTKSELRTGMQVVYTNGHRRVVMLNTERGNLLLNMRGSREFDLTEYSETLKCTTDDMSIDKIYAINRRNILDLSDKLLWERNQKHTVSIDGKERTISHESFESLKDIFDSMD